VRSPSNIPDAIAPKTLKLFMWEITSPLADRLFTLSNAVLIIGAAMVLIGTIGAIVLSGVREQFSNARISDNETKTALAIAESDTAKKGAADANARALEAQLTLAKSRAPRTLTIEQQTTISEKVRAFAGIRFDATVIRDDPETVHLLDAITPVLEAAGWTQIEWDNNYLVLKRPGKPDVGEWAKM
jgi:hypothetical protein